MRFSLGKEEYSDACHGVNEPLRHTEGNKPVMKGKALNDCTSRRYLEYDGGCQGGESLFNGKRVPVWEDGRVLEIASVRPEPLMPLNCHLDIVKMGNCTVVYLAALKTE